MGLIALAGLDAEPGVDMSLYFNIAYREFKAKGRLKGLRDLGEAAFHGAVQGPPPNHVGGATGLVPTPFTAGSMS